MTGWTLDLPNREIRDHDGNKVADHTEPGFWRDSRGIPVPVLEAMRAELRARNYDTSDSYVQDTLEALLFGDVEEIAELT